MKNTGIFSLLAAITVFAVSCAPKADLKVMSFNVRYDNPDDSLHGWAYRKYAVARMIACSNADVVGTQEALHNQLLDLEVLLPEYSYVGAGREDGAEKGEFCALLYKTSRFEMLDSGTFWLSENPDATGIKGWDAACERVATWAVLRDKRSRKEVFAINTHLDNTGEVARMESVRLLEEKIKELSDGRAAVLTGDFNVAPGSDVIGRITAGGMSDSRECAETTMNDTPGTFHDFGRIPPELRERIDYIFVTPGVKVVSYGVMPDTAGGVFLSDHTPVTAQIEL